METDGNNLITLDKLQVYYRLGGGLCTLGAGLFRPPGGLRAPGELGKVADRAHSLGRSSSQPLDLAHIHLLLATGGRSP